MHNTLELKILTSLGNFDDVVDSEGRNSDSVQLECNITSPSSLWESVRITATLELVIMQHNPTKR